MAFRHLVQRMSPRLDRRWVIGIGVAALLVLAGTFIRWGRTLPPLELVALGSDGNFQDTVRIPAEWARTPAEDGDVVARVPLILGVRNPGVRSVRPERLELSLPVRYRLDAPGEELVPRYDPSSPLVTYRLEPRLDAILPQRLPALLPAYDTLWLEVVIPAYYCVSLDDSIPEFVAAPPPPVGSMSDVRIFYSFEGGDLDRRLTGVLGVRLDTVMLHRDMPPQPPSYPTEAGRELARPDLGTLQYAGARRSRCGELEDPMELLSSVWETPSGGRFIALDYGGAVRKHLYDLDGDGVIERESWDPDGDGVFDATRQARLPIPDFLLPRTPAAYDMAALDSLTADSLRRLDPYRRAMPGPGRMPVAADSQGAPAPGPARLAARDTTVLPPLDSLPAPVIRRLQPLGRPLEADTTRPGGGGGGGGG